jgi:signal transduction histidine kinase
MQSVVQSMQTKSVQNRKKDESMNLSHTPSQSRQKRTREFSENSLTTTAFDSAQKPLGHIELLPDRMDRVRLQQALLVSQRRIQELEKDRDRIKCDLHDGVLQSLYAVGLGLESCGLLLDNAPSQVTEQLKRATVQLDQALRELRSFLKHDLGKDVEGGEDLDGALRGLVEGMTGLSPVDCKLTIDPTAIASIPKEQRKDLLHFAREALSNCLRHAQASTVEVSLTLKNGIPWLQICDDGIGFTPNHPPRRGLGLRSLTARASILGGRVDIASQPWQGTRIILELPRQ